MFVSTKHYKSFFQIRSSQQLEEPFLYNICSKHVKTKQHITLCFMADRIPPSYVIDIKLS
jgi:hypothetical protein